jgi:hypothetical protein
MQSNAEYKPIRCRCCGQQLALATPTRLLFGHGSYCDEPVPLRCRNCEARLYWRPKKQVDVSPAICYADAVPA